MIVIVKECFSRSLDKKLNIGDEVSFSDEIEKGYIDSGFAVLKQTKEKKVNIKKK